MRSNDLGPKLLRDARVMIVDDQEANVRLLESILRRSGFEHITALTDSRHALEAFADVRPDLLLLDLHMPHLDGFGVLERVRALVDGGSYLPVLVLTADADPAAKQRALGMGANDFVTKPFDAVEVVLRVKNLLETRYLYAELERRNVELSMEVAEWSDEARKAHAARSAILSSLNRLQPGASLQQTARALCVEFVRGDGFDALAFAAFNPDGSAAIVAAAGVSRGGRVPFGPDDLAGTDLRRQAQSGPWTVTKPSGAGRWDRAADGAALDGRWFAPIRSDDAVLGVLGASRRGIGAEAVQPRLELLTEYAAVARAILVPTLVLRSDESAHRTGLEEVIRSRAFSPVFQPIVDIRTGATVGFEALTRFTDRIPPDERFAEADRVGLGLDLEEATMAAAVEAASGLPSACFVSFNVSPALIVDGRLPAILAEASCDIVLEVTEHSAITDYEVIRQQLRALGPRVRLGIDDAGAGFASFRHILELSPQFVKLDRALVHAIETDPSRQALVVGMRYFAETTNCALLAEGVETAAERDGLARLGVPYGQGYFFGRPAAAPELALNPAATSDGVSSPPR